MSASNLLSKLETAVKTYLDAKRVTDVLDPINTETGQNASDKELPIVICWATGTGEEEPPFTGNFWCDLQVSTRYSAAVDVGDTAAAVKIANDDLVAWVQDAMLADDLPARLSAAVSAFYCIGAVPTGPDFTVNDGEAFDNTLRMRCLCCCTDL